MSELSAARGSMPAGPARTRTDMSEAAAGDDGPDPDRRFRYTGTLDRALVEGAAESLLRRVVRVEDD